MLVSAKPIAGSTENLDTVEKESAEDIRVTKDSEARDHKNEADLLPRESMQTEVKNKIKEIRNDKPMIETRNDRPIKDISTEMKRSASSSEIIDKVRRRADREVPSDTNKRTTSKVPAPVRPVSMINNFGDVPVAKKVTSIDEPDRVSTRNRSSSVSNRNRRRPSPPPLDRVLQIQATDKILNKNEVYGKKENSNQPRKEHILDKFGAGGEQLKNHDLKGKSKKDVSPNIVISSGKCLSEIDLVFLRTFKQNIQIFDSPYFFISSHSRFISVTQVLKEEATKKKGGRVKIYKTFSCIKTFWYSQKFKLFYTLFSVRVYN